MFRAFSEVALSNEVKIVRGESEGGKRSRLRREAGAADDGKRPQVLDVLL